MVAMPWQFTAGLLEVHDGDTIKVDADLGFRVHIDINIRLLNVYAPELNDSGNAATGNPGGPATRQFVEDWLAARPGSLTVLTRKIPGEPDTFDRYVATVTVAGESLNDAVNAFLGGKKFGRGA